MVSDFWHNIHHLTALSPPDSLKKSEPRLLSGIGDDDALVDDDNFEVAAPPPNVDYVVNSSIRKPTELQFSDILILRYSLGQFTGVALCIGGLCLAVFSDAEDSGSGGKNPILGDILVIAGTFGYAISNVAEEFCVKRRNRVEYISMLAVFALILCFCQISIFERKNLESVKWTSEVILLYFTFALSSFLFYTIVPFVMKMSGSALFSLSVLTSDMWAVLIRLFVYHQKINLLYFLAYGVVAIGLIIYSVTDKDPSVAPDSEVGDSNIQYQQLLLDENGNWCNEIVPISKDEHSQQRVTEI